MIPRKTKLKDLKYEILGEESDQLGHEIFYPLIFIFIIMPLTFIAIGFIIYYSDAIDSIVINPQFVLMALSIIHFGDLNIPIIYNHLIK